MASISANYICNYRTRKPFGFLSKANRYHFAFNTVQNWDVFVLSVRISNNSKFIAELPTRPPTTTRIYHCYENKINLSFLFFLLFFVVSCLSNWHVLTLYKDYWLNDWETFSLRITWVNSNPWVICWKKNNYSSGSCYLVKSFSC